MSALVSDSADSTFLHRHLAATLLPVGRRCGNPQSGNSNKKYALFHIPCLSDYLCIRPSGDTATFNECNGDVTPVIVHTRAVAHLLKMYQTATTARVYPP